MQQGNTLTRSQKGLQLERQTRNSWRPSPFGIKMPSQTQPGVYYTVSLDACDCPDAMRHPDKTCKHRAAVAIFMGRFN